MNSASSSKRWRWAGPILGLLLAGALTSCSTASRPGSAASNLAQSLSFHASFDQGLDADFARGSREFRHAPSMDRRKESSPGLPAGGDVVLASGAGRFGNALHFVRRGSPIVFYPAWTNMGYRTSNWSGTVSFWLRVDPQQELAMSYCDPIQITPRSWNDAAFFVEFEKRTNDVPFRLGVYPDLKVWNPDNRKWEEMSPAEKPLVTLNPAPFSRDRWTHVVFTFERFNTGRDDGLCRLYLDGAPVATLGPRRQTFTWDEREALMMLGLSYIGLWDELSVFDRALGPDEVRQLHSLPRGVAELHP